MKLDDWAPEAWPLLPIRAKTLYVYQGKYRSWIAPYFGGQSLDAISRRDVQSWILKLEAVKGKEALPILKTLYREAINFGLTDNNPTLGIRKKPYQPTRRPFLLWQDLLRIDFGSAYNNLFRFLACHGLRWSECQALTESDIDGDWVHVSRSTYGPTKNMQTRRVPYLGYYDDFARSYSWARRRLRDRAEVTVHSLRYTYAHSLKSAGVHPQLAQRFLGHSSVALTLDLYTHVMPDELQDAGATLRGHFRESG